MYDKWLADRTRWFDASGIRKVFDLAAKLENPVNLSIGQPDFDAPETARQAAIEAISSRKNGYTPTQGAAVLRQLVQKQVDEQYGAGVREAFIASGTSGALFLTIMTLVNPGDEVIIFDPFFVMYDALVRMVGAKPVYISTYPDFHIDVNKVEAAITDKTKLIILNSPCNPTGAAYSAEKLSKLAEILRKHPEVTILWDNIYSQLVYNGFEHVELAKIAPDLKNRIITTGGFSKSFAMTGWRLGFAIADPARIKLMSTLQSHSTSNAVSFAQAGAIQALRLDPSVVENMRQAFERRRTIILSEIAKFPDLSCLPPNGAFYIMLNCTKFCGVDKNGVTIHNDVDLAQYLLEKGLVATVPGTAFGAPGYLRLSFAMKDDDIIKGIQRIGNTLEDLK